MASGPSLSRDRETEEDEAGLIDLGARGSRATTQS